VGVRGPTVDNLNVAEWFPEDPGRKLGEEYKDRHFREGKPYAVILGSEEEWDIISADLRIPNEVWGDFLYEG
jgi:hypothetical protein